MSRKSTSQRGAKAPPSMLDDAGPKTTRPDAVERREPVPLRSTAESATGRVLDAVPDRIDIRDWFYYPRLAALPDQLVNVESVPAILDQGQEGACTGYALAAVINYLLRQRNLNRRVSPRMLYEMARRYDEWPGEGYEGSSARGGMSGWARHGVCEEEAWPAGLRGPGNLTPQRAEQAMATPGGAYFRVMHRQVRDMHAALCDTGILYCTLMVHEGWATPGPGTVDLIYVENGNLRKRTLPIIQRKKRADAGHAIAIVGYTYDGFIVQNSWGPEWGDKGFALLPYEDYLLHAVDVWVGQLGVPVRANLWVDENRADSPSGLHRASESIPLAQIRPFIVDAGQNGQLSDSGQYWTTETDVDRLFKEIIPETTKNWSKRRVLLYLHGGLNDEVIAAKRVIAFRDVLLANEIYPLHIMWESGALETLNNIIRSFFVDPDPMGGGIAEWLSSVREGLLEAKDRTFEMTVAKPGTSLWNRMKENARLASHRQDKTGAMQVVARKATEVLTKLTPEARKEWELHVVAHSAGSGFLAHALQHLVALKTNLRTVSLMAPAITVELFKETIMPAVADGECPHPSLFILSDQGERDDNVGPAKAYGKSLLYLVSNAFEGQRNTPLVGMQKFVSDRVDPPSGQVDAELNEFFKQKVDGRPSLVIAGEEGDAGNVSRSDSHGGFDNDEHTLNSILHRILGQAPNPGFTLQDMQYDT